MRGREIKERGGRGGGGGGGESERKREREGTEGDRERMKRWTVATSLELSTHISEWYWTMLVSI